MTVVASNFERKANELYETEEWATRALLKHFPLFGEGVVWEPAAGNHKIADVLTKAGAVVRTSDIVTYDRPHTAIYDFLIERPHREPGIRDLVTNPPYGKGNRQAVQFARLALERCDGFVALLLTAKFDFGKTRYHLFRDNPRFLAKIALTDRVQWFPGDTSGTEDHAWYVWGQRNTVNTPVLLYADRSDGAA